MTLQERARSWLRMRSHIDPQGCQLVRDLLDEIEYLEARLEGAQLERALSDVAVKHLRLHRDGLEAAIEEATK